MGSRLVVLPPVLLDQDPRLLRGVKPLPIQALVPEAAVEALAHPILPARWCNAAQMPRFQAAPTSGDRLSAPSASLADALRRLYRLERELGRVVMHDGRTAPGPGFRTRRLPLIPPIAHSSPAQDGRTTVLPLYPMEAQAAEVI